MTFLKSGTSGSHISGSTQGSDCIELTSSQCWCMVWKHRLSQRFLLDDWMLLIHDHSEKSLGSCLPDILPMQCVMGVVCQQHSKQIETRTRDGRRRITPIFIAPQPDVGSVTFCSNLTGVSH